MSAMATTRRRWLREFRWPALWVAIWIAMIAAVVASSLLPAHDLPEVPDGFDKVEHFLGYLLLGAWAVMLFATRRAQAVAAAGLIALGVALEVAQGAWTVSRMADSAAFLTVVSGSRISKRYSPASLMTHRTAKSMSMMFSRSAT